MKQEELEDDGEYGRPRACRSPVPEQCITDRIAAAANGRQPLLSVISISPIAIVRTPLRCRMVPAIPAVIIVTSRTAAAGATRRMAWCGWCSRTGCAGRYVERRSAARVFGRTRSYYRVAIRRKSRTAHWPHFARFDIRRDTEVAADQQARALHDFMLGEVVGHAIREPAIAGADAATDRMYRGRSTGAQGAAIAVSTIAEMSASSVPSPSGSTMISHQYSPGGSTPAFGRCTTADGPKLGNGPA